MQTTNEAPPRTISRAPANPAASSAGRGLRKVASRIGLAILAAVLGLTFFLLMPTPATYHMTERYSFAARGNDAPVRLTVIILWPGGQPTGNDDADRHR